MTYSVKWLIKNEILLIKYADFVTVDELSESMEIARQMMTSSPQREVHIIGDAGEITGNLSAAESIRGIRSLALHPSSGWNITLGEKSILHRTGIALKTTRQQIRIQMCDTLEEALGYLKQYDEPVNWANLNDEMLALLPPATCARLQASTRPDSD